ncbi:hypothetical protein QQ008_09465 [Fulvivirgaceae bacterium BMA10]|uniref:Protein SirB1 N-terminal domain-containing protein n=1 Tax=Splendidivirga corallicola TaxID=3051826 RepID=A0ABT8KLI9_9BACT|nr:hypothetical protein [Fulvivirgaceae bacterium BMA10]
MKAACGISILVLVCHFSLAGMTSSPILSYDSEYEEKIIKLFQSDDRVDQFDLFLISNAKISWKESEKFKANFNEFVASLEEKRVKIGNDERFLNHLFYKVHRKYLKNYVEHSSFGDVFLNGNYDCLSGTALYALILDRLEIQYAIKETDYHVLLMVEINGKQFLLESTDPLSGLVSDKEKIIERIEKYLNREIGPNQNPSQVASEESYYQYSFIVYNDITLTQLAGLQYYNQAIASYNQQDLVNTLAQLEKCLVFYHSERIEEFLTLAVSAVVKDKSMDFKTKGNLIQRFQQNLKQTVASNK